MAKVKIELVDGGSVTVDAFDFMLDFNEEKAQGVSQSSNSQRKNKFFAEVRNVLNGAEGSNTFLEGWDENGGYVFIPASSVKSVVVSD